MNKVIEIMDDMIEFLSEEATQEQESNNLIRYNVVLEQISIVKILKVRIQMELKWINTLNLLKMLKDGMK